MKIYPGPLDALRGPPEATRGDSVASGPRRFGKNMKKDTGKDSQGNTGKSGGDASVRWCLTDGWGDCESRVEPWHRAKSFHTACRAIGRIASGRYPEFRKVWTFSYTERGVVCDFGSYRFFGFIENAKFPEVGVSPECAGSSSDVSLPHGGKPDKEVSAPEYLECDDGKRLADLFSRYFSEALGRGGSWWMSHALEYCCMQEWWGMLTEDEPCISEIWDYDMSPCDIFEHVRHWAENGGDAAAVLTITWPDARFDEFHRAFTYGEE